MANLRTIWRNPAEDATVTAATQAADYPAANVLSYHLAEAYRTGGTQAAEYLVFDLGAAATVECVALLDHDLDGTETGLQIEANSSDSWGAPAFSRTLTHTDDDLVEFFAFQVYRYWRVSFTKALAADVRTIGRVVLGQYYEAAVNPARDSLAWGYRDLSEHHLAPGGQHYAARGALLRTLSARFQFAPAAMVTEWREMAAAIGTTAPLLVVFNADATDPLVETLHGRLVRVGAIRGWTGAEGRRALELEVLEWR